LSFLTTIREWRESPAGGVRWLGEAIANVREGLVPYLAAPPFVPWSRTRIHTSRSFPRPFEMRVINQHKRPDAIVDALDAWKKSHA
jgi:hypothetical protein